MRGAPAGAVRHLGVDETSFLAANRNHATVYATGLVDPEAKVVIDMVQGNRGRRPAQMDGQGRPGVAGRHRGGGHRPGRVVPSRAVSSDDTTEAALLLDKAITGCAEDDVPEIISLGATLTRWRSEILAYHDTGASNGPTEGLNLCLKKVKPCGHRIRTFKH